jgi:hypothetical protein
MLMTADACVPATDGSDWERVDPSAAGFDPAKLETAVAFARAHESRWPTSLYYPDGRYGSRSQALPFPGPEVYR